MDRQVVRDRRIGRVALEVVEDLEPGFGSGGDGERGRERAGLPARGSGRRELPRRSWVCAIRSCRGRWPMGSARSRSSRPWGGEGSWGFSGGGAAAGARSSRRSTGFSAGLGDSIPYGINLIHSPGEPADRVGRRRPAARAAGAAGRGVRISQSDIAGGSLSGGGARAR